MHNEELEKAASTTESAKHKKCLDLSCLAFLCFPSLFNCTPSTFIVFSTYIYIHIHTYTVISLQLVALKKG